jgi:nucleotide-binding universal stress UspA family protein
VGDGRLCVKHEMMHTVPFMFKNILLAVDGSKASLEAARQGIALAKCLKASVTAVVVTIPWATYFARELAVVVPDIVFPEAEYEQKRNAIAAHILDEVEADAREAGVAAKRVHRSHRDPSRAILDVAEHESCDAIVMAPHGERGLAGMLIGSETMTVITHSRVPVLVCRQGKTEYN